MNNDKIFVKAYTKTDGTEVSAHWRNKGPHTDYIPQHENDSRTQNLTLDGGVSTTDIDLSGLGISLGSALGQVFGTIGTIAGVTINVGMKVAEVAVDIYGKLKDSGVLDLNDINKIKNSISQIESTQRKYIENKNQLIEKIVNTKSQTEYSNLHDTLQKQNYLINKNNQIINEIKLAEQQQNYEKIADKLTEFNQEQQRILNEIYQPMSDLSQKPIPPRKTQWYPQENINRLEASKDNWKKAYDIGSQIVKYIPSIKDAAKIWQFASMPSLSYNYITKNGSIVYRISDLPHNLQNIVRQKIKTQYKIDECIGLILKPQSSIAQTIANCLEYQDYLKRNLEILKKGAIIKNGSLSSSDLNIKYTLGKFDILFTVMDDYGNIYSLILDTYDFNPGEAIFIEIAREFQEKNFLLKFYSLIIVKISINNLL